MEWGPDRWRLYRLALSEGARAVRTGLGALQAFAQGRTRAVAGQLISPQDLRTSDPTVANDIYAGLFVFAGRALSTGGRSPFDFAPPSQEWGEALYGFGWLRHLRAADSALARANARALVDEFARGRGDRRIRRQPHVTARRLISWLSQAPLLIEGADYAFYSRFLRMLTADVRQLEVGLRRGVLPQRRLTAAIALSFAGLCCEGLDRSFRRASRVLARELERQILPDGGHVSRDPRAGVDLLLDLLPLRQTFVSRGLEPPPELIGAIDRMLPHLRLLRHRDGMLSHFNGMGATTAGHIATLLIYDHSRGRPMQRAPQSGYERLESADGTIVVTADVGRAPPAVHSARAHAGCVSFELSSGTQRIVVNCGSPLGGGEARRLSRATAAHSTATIGDASSARFLARQGWWPDRLAAGWVLRRIGPIILSGPGVVRTERREEAQSVSIRAVHNGYGPRFGIAHQRWLNLAADGTRLEGEDSFEREEGTSPRPDIVLRFHLHPGAKASRVAAGRAVMITLANRETWEFDAEARLEPEIEESIFFAASEGGRRTGQIVLRLQPDETVVRWRFRRLADPMARGGPA